MTVSSQETKILYEPDGAATVFYVTFPVRDAADVECLLARDGTELVYTSGVTIQGIDQGKAAAHFVDPPPAGSVLVIRRDTRRVQESEYPVAGRFPAKVLEQDLDRIVMMIQELAEGLSRALKVPVSELLDWDELVKNLFEASVNACACADAAKKDADAAKKDAGDAKTAASTSSAAAVDAWHARAGAESARNAAAFSASEALGVLSAMQGLIIGSVDDPAVWALLRWTLEEIGKLRVFPDMPSRADNGRTYVYSVANEADRLALGVTLEGGVTVGGLTVETEMDGGMTESGEGLVYAITDGEGRVPFGIAGDGGLLAGGLEIRTTDQDADRFVYALADAEGQAALGIAGDGGLLAGGLEIRTTEQDADRFVYALADEDGYVAFGVTPSGELVLEGQPYTGGGSVEPPLAGLELQHTDVMHIFSYGQSLSHGGAAMPALSTTQPWQNLTFLSGVIAKGSSANYASFKPLVEQSQESPVSGFLNDVSELMQSSKGGNWVCLGTAPGVGGARIDELSKGTPYWEDFMAQASAGAATANGLWQSYSVWGVCWIQGEAEYAITPTTNKAAYKAALKKIRDDFVADAKAITGQGFDPLFLTYQVGSHRGYNRADNHIALAHLECSLEDEGIILACPMYMLEYVDHAHLTNVSSQMLGKYMARAFFRSAFAGKRWKPVQPELVLWQGRIIDMTFHVPVGSLEWDTTWVSAAPHYGFDIWNGGVQDAGAIASVTLAAADRVRVVLARDPQIGDVLNYAKGRVGDPTGSGGVGRTSGARGNLRDSAGYLDSYVINGQTRHMHNWCVMFSLPYKP